MKTDAKISVLIVDDSALIRSILTQIINGQPDMVVVGTAADPYIAREQIKKLSPDVLTLDIEMPRMDGITFLKNLMRLRPMPVIMISTLTEAGADITLEALEIGAFDFITKPRQDAVNDLSVYAEEIAEKVRGAAQANTACLERHATRTASDIKPGFSSSYKPRPSCLIAIGASTGGTQAISEILTVLPENFPPVVIAQHIPPAFSQSYAQRMDRQSKLRVQQAEARQRLDLGQAYIAPGGEHLLVGRAQQGLVTRLSAGARVNRHRPSVEVLFDSVTAINCKYTIGVLLTGMGTDGAEALLRMKQAGHYTIVQDKASSVVWGMPGAAHRLNAQKEMLPLSAIAARLVELTNREVRS